jgi:hypothetical protein
VAGLVAAADARRVGLVRLVPESGDGVDAAVGAAGALAGGGEPLATTAALWRVGALARAGLDPLADGLEAVAAVDAAMGSWWLPAGSVSVTAPARPPGPVAYGRADVPTRRRAAALAAQVARYEEQVAAAAEAGQQAAAARAELAALRRRARLPRGCGALSHTRRRAGLSRRCPARPCGPSWTTSRRSWWPPSP